MPEQLDQLMGVNLNNTLGRTFCAVAAAIATLSPLYCQASDTVGSTKISYADLNLANTADVRTLYGRLAKAADQVCPDDSAIAHQACVREAMGDAVRRTNVTALSMLYTKMTGVRVNAVVDVPTLVAKSR